LEAQVPNYVPQSGLIGWWPFNGNANDESGNGNHGIMMNEVKFSRDRSSNPSKAITLQGDSSYVVTSLKTIQSNSYTISCWFKTSEIMSDEIGLVVSRKAAFQSDGLYLFDTNGYIQCVTECDQRFHYNGKTEKYNDDKWHHFVSVFDGKKMFGYVDGKLFSIQNLEVTTCIVSPFEFGRDNPYGRYFKGEMDDIGIWSRALSEEEVKGLFESKQDNSVVPDFVPSSGLVGWWPFNGNANDESGNGNHGTMIDGAKNVTDRLDQPNYALGLDGINDFVSLKNPFPDCMDFSISAWVLHINKGNYSGILSDADLALGNDLFFNINNSDIGISADKSGGILTSCPLPEVGYNPTPIYSKGSFDSVWVHVVVTTTQSQTKIYINGEIRGESKNGGSNIGYHNPNPVFGKITDQGYSIQYFKGKLDDIGMWNRALDSNEIVNLYKGVSVACSYAIKESDTTVCAGTTVELNAIQTSSIKSKIPKDGLIGYWPFNGNANDECGNNNHGKIIGELDLTTDRFDKSSSSYNFKGKGHIQLPSLNLPSFTLNAWVKPNPNITDNGVVISKHYSSSTTNSSYLMYSAPEANSFCTPKIYFTDSSTNPYWVEAKGSSWCDSNWHMITGTLDTSWLKVYFDGVLVDSINGGIVQNTDYPTLIGASYSLLGEIGNQNFGKIDDIAFYNRSLSANEVSGLFNINSSNCLDTLSNDKFVWSTGQKGRKVTVKPDSTTMYTLTVNEGSTIHRDTIKVTVGGDSCITCIYGIKQTDTTICQGTVLELNADIDTVAISIPKDGLIGWWPFNGNANDESGYGNHGIVDKATLTSDKNNAPNSAYRFYKSGSKIKIPDATMLNNPNLSMSFWVKTSDSTLHSYIYKSQEGIANNEEYGIVSNFTRINSLEFSVKNGSNCIPARGWERNIIDTVIFDGNWHHISATYDGIYSKIFVDAELISEIQKPFFPIDSCPGGDILFGKGWNNDANLDGILDDIAIWNRAISHAEVKTMYKLNRPKPAPRIPTDGLVGYWPFDGNAKDQTSFENHGTVKGATLTTDRCQNRNAAYEFNGIDNFIEVANSQSLSEVESITMSAWILLDTMRYQHQGICTKWWQGVNCTKNSDTYTMSINNHPQTNYQTKLVCGTNNYSNYDLQTTNPIPETEWVHLMFVHNSSTGGKLYVNSVLAGTTGISGSICQSTNPLLIGADNNQGTYWRFFDGKIDDIAIWNRPLSDSEVAQVYNAGSCNCTDTLPENKFTWSTGEKGRKISVSPNASTMYTLEVDRGKKIDRDTIHVTVLESPTPDIFGHVKVYERQINYSYYTPFNDSSTYEWSITGNGKLSSTNGGSSILVDFKEPGYAYLTVTETNKYGCKRDTTITIRIYRMTDIADSEIDSEGLNIYPNPMNEFGSVMVKAFIPPSMHASVSIVDMLGKNLVTTELDAQNAYREIHVPISTESLINGIYMIQLRMDGNVISKKLIINR
jgi:hypothetical protein